MLKLTFILYRLNYPTKDRHILFELGVDKKKKRKEIIYILGSIMIIRMSVALEKIQEKE